MFEALEKLEEIHAEAMMRLRSEGEIALRDCFKAFFAKHPSVYALRWAQYTPYFNDGEPCVFRVMEAEFCTEEGAEFHGSWGSAYDALSDEIRTDLGTLTGHLQSDELEPVLLAMFGDHVEITVTAEQISINEYSHD